MFLWRRYRNIHFSFGDIGPTFPWWTLYINSYLKASLTLFIVWLLYCFFFTMSFILLYFNTFLYEFYTVFIQSSVLCGFYSVYYVLCTVCTFLSFSFYVTCYINTDKLYFIILYLYCIIIDFFLVLINRHSTWRVPFIHRLH